MVSAHYCSHQLWNFCFCYILKEISFSSRVWPRGRPFKFSLCHAITLCAYSIWKHIAPFSLSLEFDQINGYRRSVALKTLLRPTRKKRFKTVAVRVQCALFWLEDIIFFTFESDRTPMVSLWRWWSHTMISTAPTKLKWPLAGQLFPVTKTLFSPF